MKTVVVYKSKSGFTKKYAEWLAEKLPADIFEASQITAEAMTAYDTVIYGAGLYAGGINGIKLIKQNLGKLEGKKIAVFATGASPVREEIISEVRDKNFTQDQQKSIRFFYLRGGFDYRRLMTFDKMLMSLMKWSLKRKKEPTPDERGMLAAYEKPVDFTAKKDIDEIISYVNS